MKLAVCCLDIFTLIFSLLVVFLIEEASPSGLKERQAGRERDLELDSLAKSTTWSGGG